jgi:ATP adenylyltransferase
MKDILYAPWRDEYINDEKIEGCAFCHISKENRDKELHVLYRDEHCFIVMNKYPYTPGHFMVIPHEHLDALENLDPLVWQHITLKAQQGVKMLKEHFNAHGVNLGMNLGAAGGAGIAEHLHFHVVPRWHKDTNFMTAVCETRVYSTDFEKIYQKLLSVAKDYFIG